MPQQLFFLILFLHGGKKYILQKADCIAGTDKSSVSHSARTLQKSACSKCSIPVLSHCTMEVVLGSRALIIGNKSALSNQSKQTDLSINFFLGLKSLERVITKITRRILVQSLAAMQTAPIPLMDICICLQEEMEGERFLGIACWCHQPRAGLILAPSTPKDAQLCSVLGKMGKQHEESSAQAKDHPPDMSSSPVFSGMEAWSVFLSFLKEMFPNCSTEDTTFSIAVRTRDMCIRFRAEELS